MTIGQIDLMAITLALLLTFSFYRFLWLGSEDSARYTNADRCNLSRLEVSTMQIVHNCTGVVPQSKYIDVHLPKNLTNDQRYFIMKLLWMHNDSLQKYRFPYDQQRQYKTCEGIRLHTNSVEVTESDLDIIKTYFTILGVDF